MNQEEINDNQNIEIQLFLEGLYRKYGYDFRNYSLAHIKRRILHRVNILNLSGILELLNKVLYDPYYLQLMLDDLSINVTEMYRDPYFYKALREDVIPLLKTYPYIKIWDAGCATGEEVYSLAILLKEEGIYDRTQIYATDFNHKVIQIAKDGIYKVDAFNDFNGNYIKAGGKKKLEDYYLYNEDYVQMDTSLLNNVIFADHNLVTDSVFAEVNMVVCRNVLIYFNRELQDQVVKLFTDSLSNGGILALGSKENLQFLNHFQYFDYVNKKERIYIKKYSF